MRVKPRSLTLAAAGVGAAVTLAAVVIPFIRFAYLNPTLHVAIDAADAVIALVAGVLVFGRFQLSRQVRDLILVYALVLLAMTNIALAGSTSLRQTETEAMATWAPALTRFVASLAFAVAAFFHRRARGAPIRRLLVVLALAVLTLAVVGSGIALFGDDLPAAVRAEHPPDARSPIFDGHPAMLGLQLVHMVTFAIAAVGFTIHAQRRRDELMGWFGAACAVNAFARLNYFLYPSLYTEYVYIGDVLRLGFYLLILIGAFKEIASYWRGLAEAAVLEERRRMARDLHDGMAQELSYIVSETSVLDRAEKGERVAHLRNAAERALDESRRAIAALTRPIDEPLDVSVAQSAEEIAGRVDVRVRFDLQEGVDVGSNVRENLLRVVREAVTNAARHGDASTITVRLWTDEQLHLTIADDGQGFDTSAPAGRRSSFGLVSMRERITGLGGTVVVTSEPGQGTEVKVDLPWRNRSA